MEVVKFVLIGATIVAETMSSLIIVIAVEADTDSFAPPFAALIETDKEISLAIHQCNQVNPTVEQIHHFHL